jgi:hypothetical protein
MDTFQSGVDNLDNGLGDCQNEVASCKSETESVLVVHWGSRTPRSNEERPRSSAEHVTYASVT